MKIISTWLILLSLLGMGFQASANGDEARFAKMRSAFSYWLRDASLFHTKQMIAKDHIKHYENASPIMLDMFLSDEANGWTVHYKNNFDMYGNEIPHSEARLQINAQGDRKNVLSAGYYYAYHKDFDDLHFIFQPSSSWVYHPGDGSMKEDIVNIYFHEDAQEGFEKFLKAFNKYTFEKNVYNYSTLEFNTNGYQITFMDNIKDMGIAWDTLILNENLKKTSYSQTEGYLLSLEGFKKLDLSSKKGVLLEGPPGTGKSLLGQILISSIQEGKLKNYASLLVVTARHLVYKNSIRRMFEVARELSPVAIFLEDIDLLGIKNRFDGSGDAESKDEILNELLNSMDGVIDNSGVLVIGTTNKTESVDAALLRSLRMGVHLHFGMPSFRERKLFFEQFGLRKAVWAKDVLSENLAARAEGLSGADIVELISIAKQGAFIDDSWEDEKLKLTFEHFEAAFDMIERNHGSQSKAADNYGAIPNNTSDFYGQSSMKLGAALLSLRSFNKQIH